MGMLIFTFSRIPFSENEVSQYVVTNVDGPFDADEKTPALLLVRGPLDSIRLVPLKSIEQNEDVGFTGKFGYTSDSRFSRKLKEMGFTEAPVKIFEKV